METAGGISPLRAASIVPPPQTVSYSANCHASAENSRETRSAGNALEKSQIEILNAVCRYVKKGGALYYSTCSLFERENDKIIGAFLKSHPDYEKAELESPLSHEKKKYGLQFLPDTAYGAGFYVCKLIRK